MKTATVRLSCEGASERILDECATEGPVVITRNGKPVAVLVAPADDDDLERLVLARSPRFRAILDKSRRSIQAGKGLTRDQFWKVVARRRRAQHGAHAKSAKGEA